MQSVLDPSFLPFGRMVPGVPLDGLLTVLAGYPLPASGMTYSPREDGLHARLEFTPWGERLYADMPYQLGYCAGSNAQADCLVRHGGSAFVCGLTDFDLDVAHRWDPRPQRFRVPARTLIELYGDTLRSAPLGRDFRILVVLPFATNTEWQGEDGVTARNTWQVKISN